MLSKGNPIARHQGAAGTSSGTSRGRPEGATLEVLGFGATGYAADVLEECDAGRRQHRRDGGAHDERCALLRKEVDVICDIGGQDIKVLFL